MSCTRKLFRDHLVAQLSKWRADSNRLIVCLDANEDIHRKSLGKALTGTDGLSMKEVVGEFTGHKVGSTYFRGSKLIDGIWATTGVEIFNACIMPVGYRIGDHHRFTVDIVKSSLVGDTPFRIQRLVSRRLNTKMPGGGAAKYIAILESSIIRHRLIERLGRAHKGCQSKREFCWLGQQD
jgi:hypothetical protein